MLRRPRFALALLAVATGALVAFSDPPPVSHPRQAIRDSTRCSQASGCDAGIPAATPERQE